MEGIIVVTLLFGSPVFLYVAKRYFNALEKGLLPPPTLGGGKSAALLQSQVGALEAERSVLEERVKNLESIVCSLDGTCQQV